MRRPTILTLVLIVSFGIGAMTIGTEGMQANEEPSERWNRTYGGSGDDIFADIAPTDDGGYILAGQTGERWFGYRWLGHEGRWEW
ncbi:hypothetical protein [Haladaptatus sp. R4]|uniref:hypothetical protein n=1 Tax=Haladaptatus sp. R4 TaxID=1679489 RepID=UPI000AB7AB00|nr:hypothetical protein [Haladaptatus sp. R4]